MADNITKIGSNYDMIEIMQQIGSNYFDNDLSTQRIGMFGFTVEGLANMFGAAILDASNRQREYNVYTASKRSTLLYEGSKLDINIDNARPAKMSAYLGILISSLVNPHSKGGYGTVDPSSNDPNHPDYRLVIEKDMTITISDYSFMVEHDILIKANYSKNTNAYTYSVQYLLEGDNDPTSYNGNSNYTIPRYDTAYETNDKYIQSYLHTVSNSESMLLFKVELVQISKESKSEVIIKNDIISLTGLDFYYSNNLSHFNIFYKRNNTSNWENIMKVPIYNSDQSYEEDVIFYEVFHDEKKIRLNITDFQPAYNSEIRIDIYSTIGTEVNYIEYSGDGSDILVELNTMDERHSYTGLAINCKPISSCKGAFDVPTLEELRTRVIRARATANSIDVNYDLINYMKSKDDSNDYVFIKKRNDIIERRYSCYMIPRLVSSDIIPSSTLDLAIVNFREKMDTSINHYNFIKANEYNNIEQSLFYKDNLSYIGEQIDDATQDHELSDNGATFYKIDEIDNTIDNNTNLNDILVPLNGIYSSDNFKGSYSRSNMKGLTKSSSFISLYSYLLGTDLKDYLKSDGHINYNSAKYIEVPNNIISSIDKYNIKPISTTNISGKYYYDIDHKIYVNDINNNSEDVILNNGALKRKIYSITSDLNGLYIKKNNSYINPLKDKVQYEFITEDGDSPIDEKELLYQKYFTNNNEFVFIKTREYDPLSSEMVELTDVINTFEDLNYEKIHIEYYAKREIESPETIDSIKYISMVEDYIYNDTTQYTYYKSPFTLSKFDLAKDNESEKIILYNVDLKFDTDSFIFTEINVDGAFDNNDVLINPDLYYDKIDISDKYYLLDRNIYDYEVGSFIPITETEFKDYIHSQYQYYEPEFDINGEYMYINSNNMHRRFIKYKENIKINDIIIYKTSTIGKKYSKNEDEYFGYFISQKDDTYNNIYKVSTVYLRELTKDNSNIGEYIFNPKICKYVKDISSTPVKGIKYSTNNVGEKTAISIKAGTPLALLNEIIINSPDYDDFSDILDLSTKESNENACTNDDCNCDCKNNINQEKKYDGYIFSPINGTDTEDPKVYYQYPIQSVRNYYTEDNNYSEKGVVFYRKNSLLPINMYETKETDQGEEERFKISEQKGLYIYENNEKLEDYMKIYTSPYTINYDIENQVTSFFLTAINKSVSMNMIEEEPNTPANFSIDSIKVFRNPITEYDQDYGSYKITVDLMINGDISNAKFTKDNIDYTNKEYVKNSIMLKGFIYGTDGKLDGWFDFDYDGIADNGMNIFRFTGELKINDELSETYCTTMTNYYSIEDLNTEYKGYDDGEDVQIRYNNKSYVFANSAKTENFLNLSISDLKIGIGCYILNRSKTSDEFKEIQTNEAKPIVTWSNESTSVCLCESVTENSDLTYPIFMNKCVYTIENESEDGTKTDNLVTVYEKYTLANVYDNSSDLLNIYTDMSSYVKTAAIVNPINEIWNKKTGKMESVSSYEVIHFTDIPIVKFSECLNTSTFSRISDNITNTHENLADLSYKITNNFSIDFKFFRTYGPCRYFKLGKTNTDTGSIDTVDLGNLDISIAFSLLIKNNLSISDADVISQLKTYIKEKIESLNIEESQDDNDYSIYISNIITDIENEFNDYVRSIELISINGYDSSYRIIYYDKPKFNNIEYFDQLTGDDVKEYVPEFINVPLNNITIKVRRS